MKAAIQNEQMIVHLHKYSSSNCAVGCVISIFANSAYRNCKAAIDVACAKWFWIGEIRFSLSFHVATTVEVKRTIVICIHSNIEVVPCCKNIDYSFSTAKT